ncbi:MAG: hypothetical protein OEY34_02460, partial [Cyclobacteriaceae bacterium]|nr:hypothetical protein [Cyclobacteriaceae bacterium]
MCILEVLCRNKKSGPFRFFFLLFLLIIIAKNGYTQTRGLIIDPASGSGKAVFDPNGDGYISQTTAGFISDDRVESELGFVPIPIPMTEPDGDILLGPVGSYSDFVDSGSEDPVLIYNDGANFLIRFRIGSAFPNSKGYSLLLDTDEKFGFSGPNADPNATLENPGFEVEINLQTNSGVYVYDLRSITCSIGQTPVFSADGHTNYQKSLALTSINGNPDYFYEFYIPLTVLSSVGVTPSTTMRMAAVTQISPKPAICSNVISDIGGLDDTTCGGNPFLCWSAVIDNFPPTSYSNFNTAGLDRSDCPTITNGIAAGATVVRGTSTESDGTTIYVYKDGNTVPIGSASVSVGEWIATVSTVVSGETIYATATAPGKSESIKNCDPEVVGQTCTSVLTNVVTNISGGKGMRIANFTGVVGSKIYLYNTDGTLFNVGLLKSGSANPVITTTSPQVINFECQTGNCFIAGVYQFTVQAPGQCESDAFYYCYNTTATTSAPSITTAQILNTTSSISGTVPTAIANQLITLFADGERIGTVKTSTTSWTIGSLNLTFGQVLTATAIAPGSCSSVSSLPKTVSKVSSAPSITGTYCTSSTISAISGSSSEAAGTSIQIFKNGTAHGLPTTVDANGKFKATGLSLVGFDVVTAKATISGGVQSSASASVTIMSKTPQSAVISTGLVYDNSTSLSGTGVAGQTLVLYMDGFESGYSVVIPGDGNWTLPITNNDLYEGAVLKVASRASGSNICDSDLSAPVTVLCSNPDQSLSVSPVSITVPSGSTVPVTVGNSQSQIIYQLFNGASSSGSALLGTGNDLVLTSAALFSNSTLNVKTFKLFTSGCSVNLTASTTVTIGALNNPPTGLNKTLST